ncbi:hypothetical protein [Vineibacter terrae]|uniref:helix-turn-helix transcriptional regulator n=1 Tax=Vineibacter terrae TaxID=2586908 RepID=UPI002E31A0E1|nr:hypothetical protein [Vineibacter terrae]HEX2885147.1 hypothetical protein [Vineibacter terrae]
MRLIGADTSYSSLQIAGGAIETLAYKDIGGPELVAVYERDFAARDVWAQGLMREVGRVHRCAEMIPTAELKRTPFYGDFLRPHYNLLYALGSMVPVGTDSMAMIGLHRVATRDYFSSHEQDQLQRLVPHIGRALHLHRRYRQWTEQGPLVAVLDRLRTAVVVVDDHQRIRFANAAALGLLSQADGIAAHNDRLVAADLKTSAALERALAVALGGAVPADCSLSVVIARRRQPRSLLASIFPLNFVDLLRGDQRAALVVLIEPSLRPGMSRTRAAMLFGLTDAESRLVDLLGQGVRLEVAADLLAISRNTARNHLAAIFRKTGINRQSELIALLMSLSAV